MNLPDVDERAVQAAWEGFMIKLLQADIGGKLSDACKRGMTRQLLHTGLYLAGLTVREKPARSAKQTSKGRKA